MGEATNGIGGIGEKDADGSTILAIFARQQGRYVVYSTAERVKICFADDPVLEQLQRRRLLPVSALRAQLASLLAYPQELFTVLNWFLRKVGIVRGAAQTRTAPRNEEIAFALIDALEGSATTAIDTLTRIRDELVAERSSKGRLIYLRAAAVTVVVVAALALIASRVGIRLDLYADPPVVINLWRAVTAGALGAFFSIARTITGRTVRADDLSWDYYVDSITRISVGCIAALVLESLLDCGAFSLSFGSATVGATRVHGELLTAWPITIVAGFLAGFSERLVPDLMAKAEVVATPSPPTPSPSPAAVAGSTTASATTGDGAAPGAVAPLADDPQGVDTPVAAHGDEAVDGCDAEHGDDDPVTADDELPAASGGVATST